MYLLMSPELAEQRRRDLLREAERERRASGARSALGAVVRGSPRRGWRVAAGLVLVRLGVRLGGAALADAVVVVPARGARPAAMAVVWRQRGGDPPRGAGAGSPRGRPPLLSRR